jgi:EAL domain-containing protein (putative c-di-GMP-specific phosphodiesterase class I)
VIARRPGRLRRALDRRRVHALLGTAGRLSVAFQPVVDLATSAVAGYEVLARFDSGDPALWFPRAHAVGLGGELELASVVQGLALRDPAWGYVSVNVSPATLLLPQFSELVERLAEPSKLVLEITEHAEVDDYDDLKHVVAHLRSLGARIAIDDAGSGISSFRHILTLAPDIVKLDRSLIARLEDDGPRRALAEALAQFADRIGADLIAEGIERPEERAACMELGIPFGQGYLLGRPAPRFGASVD